MLSLMLDLRLKTFRLVSSLIGHQQVKAINEKYDKKSLFPMLLKCYYHLHPFVESKKGVVDQRVEEDKSLDIFEMTTIRSEPTTKLVNREHLIFRHYQMSITVVGNHDSMFPTISFCVRKILGIVGFQIEIKRIFSLARILINLKRCRL
jgi:hypothetical protein